MISHSYVVTLPENTLAIVVFPLGVGGPENEATN